VTDDDLHPGTERLIVTAWRDQFMDHDAFCREIMAEPFHDPVQSKLRELVERYHEEAEAFDQSVCMYRGRNGEAVPRTPREWHTIQANARRLRNEADTKASDMGFSRGDVAEAFRMHRNSKRN
jgi:hypothetical protein